MVRIVKSNMQMMPMIPTTMFKIACYFYSILNSANICLVSEGPLALIEHSKNLEEKDGQRSVRQSISA